MSLKKYLKRFISTYRSSLFLRPQIVNGVGRIAAERIDVLAAIWARLFEPEIGQTHMESLLDHVDAFFADIISETQVREQAIRERIDSKLKWFPQVRINIYFLGLNRERQDLKRLLKEDANDVTSNVPLHTLQKNIDESLKELRDKLHARREEISTLLSEQEKLCKGELSYWFTSSAIVKFLFESF